jgi:hypothetical protein
MSCEYNCALPAEWECCVFGLGYLIGGHVCFHVHVKGCKVILFSQNNIMVAYQNALAGTFIIWNELGEIIRECDPAGDVRLDDDVILAELHDETYRADRKTANAYRQTLALLPQPIYEEIIGYCPLFDVEEWQKAAGRRYPQNRIDEF